ncbi:MAG: response regulator transcription factor [Deltaproteobacteria bacterium]|nr:response regulator transcription factor [Deltaproteobacteria bacterium]
MSEPPVLDEPRRLLIVVADPGAREHLANALSPFRVDAVATAEDAIAHLDASAYAMVIADYRLPASDGIEVLRLVRGHRPELARVLWTSYDDLREVIKKRADRVAVAVLAKPGQPENILRTVTRILAGHSPELRTTVTPMAPATLAEIRESFQTLLTQLSKIPDQVVRSPKLTYADAAEPTEQDLPNLQLVFPLTPALEAVRASLDELWGRPIVPSRWQAPWRRHPVERLFGFRTGLEVFYARRIEGDPHAQAYVAFLPWQLDPRVTIVLGLAARRPDPAFRSMLAELHEFAVRNASTYFLPTYEESTNRAVLEYNWEYDWVVTKGYVGPDRRGRTPNLFDRFALVGRRQRIARNARDLGETVVDRLPRIAVFYLVAFGLLSLLDGVFTHRFVNSGKVVELNPVVRPLLGLHPWLFLLMKVGAGALAFHAVARFHFHRLGRALLAILLGLYALVVAYWFVLLH